MIVTTLVISILTSPLWVSHLAWRLEPGYDIRLLAVDYSVPSMYCRNHAGLFWLFNHLRIKRPFLSGGWRDSHDYVGYHPAEPVRAVRVSEMDLGEFDGIYVADAHGVTARDMSARQVKAHPEWPREGLIFGGLSPADGTAISQFVKRKGHLVMEFNSIEDPTHPVTRKLIEGIVGIRWTGWAGRFVPSFIDAANEIPWFYPMFLKAYPKARLPKGEGMIMVHRDGKLVVLSGQPFEESIPSLVVTDKGRERFPGAYGSPPFYDWFSIVEKVDNVEVLAEIQLPVPGNWEAEWRKVGLEPRSPLLTWYDRGGAKRVYLAANLSALDGVPVHQLAGLPTVLAWLYRRRDSVTDRPAFWQFFVPVMGRVLTSFAEDIVSRRGVEKR
jgi:hypothetical protein